MAASIEPLSKRRAWKALAAHYKKARELHLQTFAHDPTRRAHVGGGRGPLCRLLEQGDRRNSQASPEIGGGIGSEGTDRRHVPWGQN